MNELQPDDPQRRSNAMFSHPNMRLFVYFSAMSLLIAATVGYIIGLAYNPFSRQPTSPFLKETDFGIDWVGNETVTVVALTKGDHPVGNLRAAYVAIPKNTVLLIPNGYQEPGTIPGGSVICPLETCELFVAMKKK